MLIRLAVVYVLVSQLVHALAHYLPLARRIAKRHQRRVTVYPSRCASSRGTRRIEPAPLARTTPADCLPRRAL
jgi:hypothetical protein